MDGRAADELRPVEINPGFINTVAGSVLISMGQTRVICTASLGDRVPPFLINTGKGWLTTEYGMLPGSSPQRIAREASTGKPNGRTREIQRLIGRSLRAVIDLGAIGERTLHIDCDVIQADGGTRTASVTGAYVALALAVDRLVGEGRLSRSPLRDTLAAVSVGLVRGEPLLDLSYAEDAGAETDMNVVMTGAGGLVEIQATAEGCPFTRAQADGMLDLAALGIGRLRGIQQGALASAGVPQVVVGHVAGA
ncbi:MAG: ribonuclease PH [Gemmatimonadota bacterium]